MNRQGTEWQQTTQVGYKVTAFSTPHEALDSFADQPDIFDLVITDMTMPKMTGDKLAMEIKMIRPAIPVVLCTGFSDLVDEKTAKNMGISAYITKPIIGQTFARAIRDVLNGAKKK